MPVCRIIAGPNGAGKTTFFMNDGVNPVLVFEQIGENRDISHEDYYRMLLKEGGQ